MTTWPDERFDGLILLALSIGVCFFGGGILIGFVELVRWARGGT